MTCRTDSCSQGRRRCPTPDVCNRPSKPLNWTRIGWWAAVIAAIGWAAIVHWG